MSSDTLGYMPLSRRKLARLDRPTRILLCLAFLSGVFVFWTIGYIRRMNSLGALTSALDNYQEMCVPSFLFCSVDVSSSLCGVTLETHFR